MALSRYQHLDGSDILSQTASGDKSVWRIRQFTIGGYWSSPPKAGVGNGVKGGFGKGAHCDRRVLSVFTSDACIDKSETRTKLRLDVRWCGIECSWLRVYSNSPLLDPKNGIVRFLFDKLFFDCLSDTILCTCANTTTGINFGHGCLIGYEHSELLAPVVQLSFEPLLDPLVTSSHILFLLSASVSKLLLLSLDSSGDDSLVSNILVYWWIGTCLPLLMLRLNIRGNFPDSTLHGFYYSWSVCVPSFHSYVPINLT